MSNDDPSCWRPSLSEPSAHEHTTAAIERLAQYLDTIGIPVVGVQTMRHAALGGGHAITLTPDGALRLAQRLGAGADGPAHEALQCACEPRWPGVTVADELGNVRIGQLTASDATAIAAAVMANR